MEDRRVVSPVAISVSVVSHNQINLIFNLLKDIETISSGVSLEVIITLNVEEKLPFDADSFSFFIKTLQNKAPLGFGTNHNQAFKHAIGDYFCVINPDIRLNSDSFSPLIETLRDNLIGVAGPLVLNEIGNVEDSARYFPTPLKILCKLIGKCRGGDYVVNKAPISPDWIGGMFMLFRKEVFAKLKGFDERFFLYYEDVDLCARARLAGYSIILNPKAQAIHCAQRSSHRHFKYLKWHLTSMMRFFCSLVFLHVLWQKLIKNNHRLNGVR